MAPDPGQTARRLEAVADLPDGRPPASSLAGGPRIGVSVRVYSSYRTALDGFTRHCQGTGMPLLQRYDVLEHLMRDVLTDAGRLALLARLVQPGQPRSLGQESGPRGMLSVRVRREYMDGLRLTLDTAVALDAALVRLERYDVLEHLMQDLLTVHGRERIRMDLRVWRQR